VIEAVIFDLDGTLVETEELKALSYARAAVELRPDLEVAEIVESFKDFVGLSRREVAKGLMERFELEEAARARMEELGVSAPWQAYVQVRYRIYEAMLDDPTLLHQQQYLHNIAYLREIRRSGIKIGLATMSYHHQVHRVLNVLGLTKMFDFIATRDDVEHGKPDPEIYLLVARELQVEPENCLVIEDSPTGVKAALAAGMSVVAVSTALTRQRLYESGLLPVEHIVDTPEMLSSVIAHVTAQHQLQKDEKVARAEAHTPDSLTIEDGTAKG
jgi:beta-phosphoglucomutase